MSRAHLAVIALGVATAAYSAEPSHVVIDPSDQHTTTFVGVPKALPEKQFDVYCAPETSAALEFRLHAPEAGDGDFADWFARRTQTPPDGIDVKSFGAAKLSQRNAYREGQFSPLPTRRRARPRFRPSLRGGKGWGEG